MQTTAIRPLKKQSFRHPDDVDEELASLPERMPKDMLWTKGRVVKIWEDKNRNSKIELSDTKELTLEKKLVDDAHHAYRLGSRWDRSMFHYNGTLPPHIIGQRIQVGHEEFDEYQEIDHGYRIVKHNRRVIMDYDGNRYEEHTSDHKVSMSGIVQLRQTLVGKLGDVYAGKNQRLSAMTKITIGKTETSFPVPAWKTYQSGIMGIRGHRVRIEDSFIEHYSHGKRPYLQRFMTLTDLQTGKKYGFCGEVHPYQIESKGEII